MSKTVEAMLHQEAACSWQQSDVTSDAVGRNHSAGRNWSMMTPKRMLPVMMEAR